MNWTKRRTVELLDRDGRNCRKCNRHLVFTWEPEVAMVIATSGMKMAIQMFDIATIDHIIPKSKKGSNKLENLRLLCAECNNRKGDSLDIDIQSNPQAKEKAGSA